MIEAHNLTKRYGAVTAVDDLSFTLRPGMVTGFLGPNGAGKTTTMRMILGLDHPTNGSVAVAGRDYRDLPAPLHEVGALLDAKAMHGGRSAYNHLLCLAQSNGINRRRVSEVLRLVGLEAVASRRSGGFSLGMGQRLGIAGALLGDPPVLMFDEPVNGLDPEGIVWGPHPDAQPGRRGADRPGIQPPDERDGADRRPPADHRAGSVDRRRCGERVRGQ